MHTKKKLTVFVYIIGICDFWLSIRTIYEEKCITYIITEHFTIIQLQTK